MKKLLAICLAAALLATALILITSIYGRVQNQTNFKVANKEASTTQTQLKLLHELQEILYYAQTPMVVPSYYDGTPIEIPNINMIIPPEEIQNVNTTLFFSQIYDASMAFDSHEALSTNTILQPNNILSTHATFFQNRIKKDFIIGVDVNLGDLGYDDHEEISKLTGEEVPQEVVNFILNFAGIPAENAKVVYAVVLTGGTFKEDSYTNINSPVWDNNTVGKNVEETLTNNLNTYLLWESFRR